MISLLRRASHGWISRVFGPRQQKPRLKARPRLVRLNLESLEERITPTNWSGNIQDPSLGVPLWTNSSVQVVTGSVNVPAGDTLTVQAGTVVQFDPGTSLTVAGTLIAQGATGQTIYFTSIRDNSPMSGTNTAAAGDWVQIEFGSTSTADVLSDVVVRYGGEFSHGEVEADSASPAISNSTIANATAAGVRLQGSNATLTGDTFQNNGGAAVSMDVASDPSISTPTLTNNGVNGVALDGGYINANNSWNNPSIVYVLTGGVQVQASATLTIGAGQIVKFEPAVSLTVAGALQANGTSTQPIIFTSFKDDSTGGDTNNDGSATSPSPGDWVQIVFASGSTADVFTDVVVRYGGEYGHGQIEADSAAPSISNSTIADSGAAGVRLAGSNATLTGDTFQNNASAAVSMDVASDPSVSTPTLTNNGVNGVALDGGYINANNSWDNSSIVYVLTGGIQVQGGAMLTIGAGQIVKFQPSVSLTVDSSLQANGTSTQPIIFTSYKDDSAGGDTNNDGSATSPTAGDWVHIVFASGSTADVLANVVARYGGQFNYGEIEADSASPAISNSTIANAAAAGVRLQGSNATLTGDTFQNNAGAAVSMDVASDPSISTPTLTSNGVNGVALDGGYISANNSWNNPSIVYVLTGGVQVQAEGDDAHHRLSRPNRQAPAPALQAC